MHREGPTSSRQLNTVELDADLVVTGGGLAGTCCAITAARQGLTVVLIQDRPVLGGNASSEVRLWALGATCHMGSNNRWAREGGVVNELMVENLWRNREGNALIFDTIMLEKVVEEPNITLLLNTAAFAVDKAADNPDRIAAVRAFCSQNSTLYIARAPLFADASGDGIVGFLSGAAFRMGAESKDEFDEGFAPTGEFGHLLGHSIYFYSKDIGRPVDFTPPSYALDNVPGRIPRFRRFNTKIDGCKLWWIEYGGRLDTVHETEAIKWELWKIVYGVWDYIKNSGTFPKEETQNLTLEWVGHIPGKRESRRFEGDHMLRQQDVTERRQHHDDVAFGGWSIDLHPADGVFSQIEGSHHLHARGVFNIPYRCLYSRNIENLFLAGRIISASHVAFGATRVMCTCAHGGQAVAVAAALCRRDGRLPRDLSSQDAAPRLQQALLKTGQHIVGVPLRDGDDLARQATLRASSELQLSALPDDGPALPVEKGIAQMLPLPAGDVPTFTLTVDAAQDTDLTLSVRTTSDARHHCPDVTLSTQTVKLAGGAGRQVSIRTDAKLERDGYVFVCVHGNEHVAVHGSERRASGLLSVCYRNEQDYTDVGGEKFECWAPQRYPNGHNLAVQSSAAIASFAATNVTNGFQRPTNGANAWVASPDDTSPRLTLRWDQPRTIRRVELFFDCDWDHALETVQFGHRHRVTPLCVKHFRIKTGDGDTLVEVEDNHDPRRVITFQKPVTTDNLSVEVPAMHGEHTPASVFELRCYA